MFIKNSSNEIVNLNHVLYVRVYGDRAPYEIHIFTGDNRLVLQYNSNDELKNSLKILKEAMHRSTPQWFELQDPDYYLRADKIKNVIAWNNSIKVVFNNYELLIYCRGNKPEDYLTQIVDYMDDFSDDDSAVISL